MILFKLIGQLTVLSQVLVRSGNLAVQLTGLLCGKFASGRNVVCCIKLTCNCITVLVSQCVQFSGKPIESLFWGSAKKFSHYIHDVNLSIFRLSSYNIRVLKSFCKYNKRSIYAN